MSEFVSFGEIMMRLNPPGYLRLQQATSLDVTYAGGEANVAVSIANLGGDAAFVTKLPNNRLGQNAVDALRRHGVDTSRVIRGGSRLGIYFLEKGASQRPSTVLYDRAHSSVSELQVGEIDWKSVFDGARWFHFTGITPALSENAAEVTLEACRAAQELGVTVSCDLNYRKSLWSSEKACKVMSGLMPYVQVCIANEEDAADVFGIRANDTDVTGGVLGYEGYQQVASEIVARFGCKMVAITLRESVSASDNIWSGMLYDGAQFCRSARYPIHIVDRVGGGDSFGGGLIYALMQGFDTQKSVDFAAAASCLKQCVEGDFNLVTADEVLRLAAGDGSGRVRR